MSDSGFVLQYGPILVVLNTTKQIKESGYFTQELSLEVASLSIVTIQLLVVLQVVACLAFEILFTKVLDFFNMWVFMRTSTNFAHLASFPSYRIRGPAHSESAEHFCMSDGK